MSSVTRQPHEYNIRRGTILDQEIENGKVEQIQAALPPSKLHGLEN